jgi:hypothetical protein
MPRSTIDECMEGVKAIAVAGYKRVLKDGKDVCTSESDDAEEEDHGEVPTGMCTSEMIGPGGRPLIGLSRMTTEQANALRAVGMAGGRATSAGVR